MVFIKAEQKKDKLSINGAYVQKDKYTSNIRQKADVQKDKYTSNIRQKADVAKKQ